MKKKKIITISVVISGCLILVLFFLYRQFKGALPAVRGPGQDIAAEIEKFNSETPGVNSTDFPLKMPNNISISVFAKNLGKPRDLIQSPKGEIIVSIPERGQVLALIDKDSDGVSESSVVLVSGLSQPHGLAFYENSLYIAETDKVKMYDYNEDSHQLLNGRKIIDLPGGSSHWSRSLLVTSYQGKEKLFVSTGSSCNACVEKDPRRAAVFFSNLDGSEFSPFSTGLRNAVFMTVKSSTGEIWATENGRDNLGDNLPPDELNILKANKNYGWPYCYGQNVVDVTFSKITKCDQTTYTASAVDLQAHSAPLGLAFFPGGSVGQKGWGEYSGKLLVAYHGSWNRSTPTGYKVVIVDTGLSEEGDNKKLVKDFITGWLPGGKSSQALGRPVDILLVSGGVGYISDDKAGLVYKITYLNK